MNRISTLIIGFVFLVSNGICLAQDAGKSVNWNINKDVKINPEISTKQLLKPFWCVGCHETISGDFIVPFISEKIRLDNNDIKSVSLKNIEVLNEGKHAIAKELSSEFKIEQHISVERGIRYALISISALRSNNGSIEILKNYTLDIVTQASSRANTLLKKKKDQTYNSVLESGDYYKIAVPAEGVYKIDAGFLSANGLDANSIDLSTFKVYGNGGQMLPEIIADDRPEDLQENALFVKDDNLNNKLDGNDYILWFAPGHDKIVYNSASNRYDYISHDFDEKSYYFLSWGGFAGKRITTANNGQALTPTQTIASYDHIITHENDEYNVIESGRRWWGDKMDYAPNLTKTFQYNISEADVSRQTQLTSVTAIRSLNNSSISINVTGNSSYSVSHSAVSGSYEDEYLSSAKTDTRNLTTAGGTIDIYFTYNKTLNESAAYIDYFTLNVPRKLKALDDFQMIRSASATADGIYKYQVENVSTDYQIWNVTDHLSPALQATFDDGGKSAFSIANSGGSDPLFALVKANACPAPEFIGKVENQNLHGISDVEYIIISPASLLDEAKRLEEFHESNSGLIVEVVQSDKIFNEFSSGSQDVTGIRDFLKLVYDRGNTGSTTLKYVCLFGDASYDYKDVLENNTNLVPIYQSFNSNSPANSYCSDDYYAILDDSEGYWGIQNSDEGLDLGVGRLPASNIDEARIIIDKILNYHSPESYGDWMNRLTFIGDDEDNNAHVGPSETMVDSVYSQFPHFNVNKIWLDAYEQVSFGSGNKYPQVNSDITKAINNQGTLIFNYVGHGGENGMAHERVVTRPEITSWTNYNKLAFYVTASCELARLDKLSVESPGELMFLNPNGGAIGMVATTRLVYIGANTALNAQIIDDNIFTKIGNKYRSLGDTYKKTRNDAFETANKRCFLLLADPAMSLLSPPNKVVTTSINGKSVTGFSDTLKALSLVTIEGEIRDESDALLTNFNGTLYPTLYDKFAEYQTRGNDAGSNVVEFELQNGVVYKGKVSVTGGKFSFQFIVPKDIAYNVDYGKISYYAEDGVTHAGGSFSDVLVGGTSDSLVSDQTPPDLELFIDDESWVFGGNTSTTPLMLAKIYDVNGLNTVGSGIGREMEAILDKGTDAEQSIIVNDFYTPEINSYQAGRIEYPFETLPLGKHTLSLKVWDAYNNSADAYTEFVVTEDADIVVDNLLNYPNPFNNFTTFHFDHNKAGQNLTANLTITTAAGNVVKSVTQEIMNAPTHSSDITWDGRDDFGDKIARGVYIYTLKVKAEDGSSINKTEKLYVIN